MDATTLTQRIADKGGIVGYIAKMYVSDHIKAHQFIIECYEQIHNDSARGHWGEELISELQGYVVKAGKSQQRVALKEACYQYKTYYY